MELMVTEMRKTRRSRFEEKSSVLNVLTFEMLFIHSIGSVE